MSEKEYKYPILLAAIVVLILVNIFSFKRDTAINTPSNQYYTSSGLCPTPLKHWVGVVSMSSSTQTIDISSAGFTSIISVNITSQDNTATVSAVPFLSVKSITTTALTVNLVNNSSLLTILSINLTNAAFPTSTSGMSAYVEVIGI